MKSVNYGQVVMMDTCVCYQKSLVNTEPIASLTAKGWERILQANYLREDSIYVTQSQTMHVK